MKFYHAISSLHPLVHPCVLLELPILQGSTGKNLQPPRLPLASPAFFPFVLLAVLVTFSPKLGSFMLQHNSWLEGWAGAGCGGAFLCTLHAELFACHN